MTVKFSNDVTLFLESDANIIDEYGERWYWFPHYYKKVGDGLFVASQFKDTPSGLTHIVEQSENPNPDGDIRCHCTEEEKHGETSIMCCNHCGLPTEEFWTRKIQNEEE